MKIVTLYKEGLKAKEISRHVGIRFRQVQKWANKFQAVERMICPFLRNEPSVDWVHIS